MENRDIDELFRKAFKDAEQDVNPKVWQNIELDLDNKKKIIHPIFRTHIWMRYAVIFLMVLGVGFIFMKKEKKDKVLIAEKDVEAQFDVNSPVSAEIPNSIVVVAKSSQKLRPLKQKIKNSSQIEEEIGLMEQNIEKELVEVQLDMQLQTVENSLDLPVFSVSETSVVQVTEVEPIKPLIQLEEEEESMYAVKSNPSIDNRNIVTDLLNGLSRRIDLKTDRELQFKTDDEGGIVIDLVNSFAKNRKKRK